jgi:hypothetical protein
MADFKIGDGRLFLSLSLPVGRVAELARFGYTAVVLA